MNGIAKLMFRTPHERIMEHPNELKVKGADIPEGPLKGWFAVAPDQSTSTLIGLQDPTIERPYNDKDAVTIAFGKSQYWFNPNDYERPCWYQSNTTVRFFKNWNVAATTLRSRRCDVYFQKGIDISYVGTVVFETMLHDPTLEKEISRAWKRFLQDERKNNRRPNPRNFMSHLVCEFPQQVFQCENASPNFNAMPIVLNDIRSHVWRNA